MFCSCHSYLIIHIYVHAQIYIYMYAHVHTYIRTYIYICREEVLFIGIQMEDQVWSAAYIYTCIHIHVHVYVHQYRLYYDKNVFDYSSAEQPNTNLYIIYEICDASKYLQVGSTVILQITKGDSKQTIEFVLKRADFRQVEKIKVVCVLFEEDTGGCPCRGSSKERWDSWKRM